MTECGYLRSGRYWLLLLGLSAMMTGGSMGTLILGSRYLGNTEQVLILIPAGLALSFTGIGFLWLVYVPYRHRTLPEAERYDILHRVASSTGFAIVSFAEFLVVRWLTPDLSVLGADITPVFMIPIMFSYGLAWLLADMERLALAGSEPADGEQEA